MVARGHRTSGRYYTAGGAGLNNQRRNRLKYKLEGGLPKDDSETEIK